MDSKLFPPSQLDAYDWHKIFKVHIFPSGTLKYSFYHFCQITQNQFPIIEKWGLIPKQSIFPKLWAIWLFDFSDHRKFGQKERKYIEFIKVKGRDRRITGLETSSSFQLDTYRLRFSNANLRNFPSRNAKKLI